MRPINAIATELADVSWSIKAFRRRRDFGRSDRRALRAGPVLGPGPAINQLADWVHARRSALPDRPKCLRGRLETV